MQNSTLFTSLVPLPTTQCLLHMKQLINIHWEVKKLKFYMMKHKVKSNPLLINLQSEEKSLKLSPVTINHQTNGEIYELDLQYCRNIFDNVDQSMHWLSEFFLWLTKKKQVKFWSTSKQKEKSYLNGHHDFLVL